MQPGIYVIGVATHPPAERHDGYRLEELVYHTARAALDDAGVTRDELDSVTLGAQRRARWPPDLEHAAGDARPGPS